MVQITIDDQRLSVADGATIIEAADQAGIYIPRFCYHPKLSIAANCRMCLVAVENARKPMPACATPVTEGMVVYTRSPSVLKAQREVLEFLLINHPLDCPICDQGGECELQDLSMGYGSADSCYEQPKRAVSSPDIGPLIETAMTRCIHCTRCVRFGEEVAGLREMGMLYRGESSQIGTYVQQFLHSELSGNIIDLCPVGALINKPARYQGRSWEYHAVAQISPHDSFGSHLSVHTRADVQGAERQVMRAVPKESVALNETWLSDRDRYSVHGLYDKSRVYMPRVKQNGQWHTVTWSRALDEIQDRFGHLINEYGGAAIGALASMSSTTEEHYLLQKMMRQLGSNHIDHRIQQQDFSDAPLLADIGGASVDAAAIESAGVIVLVGAFLREQVPLLSHRVRKAAMEGATVIVIDTFKHDYNFPVAHHWVVAPQHLASAINLLAQGVLEGLGANDHMLSAWTDALHSISAALKGATQKIVCITGQQVYSHPQAGSIRRAMHKIVDHLAAGWVYLTPGANSIGAYAAGAVPHQAAGFEPVDQPGLNAYDMLAPGALKGYLLFNTELEDDCAYPERAVAALAQAACVVCITPFASDAMLDYADFILPLAPFTETQGSRVNFLGHVQRFEAATVPHQSAKPGWKILRVMANYFQLPGFEYTSIDEVFDALAPAMSKLTLQINQQHAKDQPLQSDPLATAPTLMRMALWPMYRIDNLTRRSAPLQAVFEAQSASQVLAVNRRTAEELGFTEGMFIQARQHEKTLVLPLAVDDRLPDNAVWLPLALPQTLGFGAAFSAIELTAESV